MHIKKIIKNKSLRLAILPIAGILVLLLLGFSAYSIVYAGKIYRNQYIGDDNYAGKKKVQVQSLFESRAEEMLKTSMKLRLEGGDEFELSPTDLGLTYKTDESVNKIWSAGRNHNPFIALAQQIKSIFLKTKHPAIFEINDNVLNEKIATIAEKLLLSLPAPVKSWSPMALV